MGEYDLVKVVLDKLGEMEWMQIAIQPAKPFAFGLLGLARALVKVPVFGLPGNPVSSFVSFEVLARPALRQMMGVSASCPGATHCRRSVADQDIRSRTDDGKEHLMRMVAEFGDDGRLHVAPIGSQGSHQLAASAGANGLAILPRRRPRHSRATRSPSSTSTEPGPRRPAEKARSSTSSNQFEVTVCS